MRHVPAAKKPQSTLSKTLADRQNGPGISAGASLAGIAMAEAKPAKVTTKAVAKPVTTATVAAAAKKQPTVAAKTTTAAVVAKAAAANGLVTADLLQVEFATAIQTIARQTGTSYVIAPDLGVGKVTAKFNNTSEADAFNAICFARGAVWRHRGNVVYFLKRDSENDNVTDLVTLHLKSVTMKQAAAELSHLMGVSIEVGWSDERMRMDVSLDNANIEEALAALCQPYGLLFEGRNNNWVIKLRH
jgi:type II secretory pathway component GspD/PulD (secretin)